MFDTYKVLFNPMRFYNKWEVWVSGSRKTWPSGSYDPVWKTVTYRMSTFRTEQKALSAIKYWEELQSFKEENKSEHSVS